MRRLRRSSGGTASRLTVKLGGGEREAKTKVEARTWNRIALAIARKKDKLVGLDTATRMTAG